MGMGREGSEEEAALVLQPVEPFFLRPISSSARIVILFQLPIKQTHDFKYEIKVGNVAGFQSHLYCFME